MKLLACGLDTIECAYYLQAGADCKLDFAALRAWQQGRFGRYAAQLAKNRAGRRGQSAAGRSFTRCQAGRVGGKFPRLLLFGERATSTAIPDQLQGFADCGVIVTGYVSIPCVNQQIPVIITVWCNLYRYHSMTRTCSGSSGSLRASRKTCSSNLMPRSG